jgi:hypothetical protein
MDTNEVPMCASLTGEGTTDQLASRGAMTAGEIPVEQLIDSMGVVRTGGIGSC